MKYLPTAAAIILLLSCGKEQLAPTTADMGAPKSVCDSLQNLVDSLQGRLDKSCGEITSTRKHWNQANERAASEAANCCEYASIVYQEMTLMAYYLNAADSLSACGPLPYPLSPYFQQSQPCACNGNPEACPYDDPFD